MLAFYGWMIELCSFYLCGKYLDWECHPQSFFKITLKWINNFSYSARNWMRAESIRIFDNFALQRAFCLIKSSTLARHQFESLILRDSIRFYLRIAINYQKSRTKIASWLIKGWPELKTSQFSFTTL